MGGRCAPSKTTFTRVSRSIAPRVLLIDVDGLRESGEAQAPEVAEICRLHHAREVRVARDAARTRLAVEGRKNAFGAVGRTFPIVLHAGWRDPANQASCTLRRIERNWQANTASKSAIFSMRATATSIRLSSSTSATPNSSNAPWPAADEIIGCASRWAARLPASTASAWRRTADATALQRSRARFHATGSRRL